jgi:hypothetical protein
MCLTILFVHLHLDMVNFLSKVLNDDNSIYPSLGSKSILLGLIRCLINI